MKIGHLRKNHRLGLHAHCLKAALPYDPNFTSVGLMCIKHNASRRFSRGLLRDCETLNSAKVRFQLYYLLAQAVGRHAAHEGDGRPRVGQPPHPAQAALVLDTGHTLDRTLDIIYII